MRTTAATPGLALLVAAACGASPPDVATQSTGTGGGPDSGEAPTTAGPPTPTSDATTDASSSTTTDTTAQLDTTDHTATTTAASTSAAATTGAVDTTTGGEPITRAWWVDGDELQLRIFQQDPGAGLCRGVILGSVDSSPAKYAPVTTPPTWGVRYVFVHDVPADCFDPYLWYENGPAHADGAAGTVDFHDLDMQGKPLTLDLDLTGDYAPGEPWTPPVDHLLAVGVAVEVG